MIAAPTVPGRLLQEMAHADPRLRAQRFASNCGESAAVWAGIKSARGDYVITMDADLQNDPAEIPRFVRALERFDCVSGSRVQTRGRGDNILRVVTSRVGNAVRNWLSGDQVSDSGCTFRAFKRECADNLIPFSGMHRFMPTLIKWEGYRVGEIPVVNQPRYAGRSHYGFWNRLIFLQDLLAVRWMKKRRIRYQIADCTEAESTRPSRLAINVSSTYGRFPAIPTWPSMSGNEDMPEESFPVRLYR